MNIAYGALALFISFVVAKYFSHYKASKLRVFTYAFIAEFIAVILLGAIFYFLGLGFFDGPLDDRALIMKVAGFAIFLSILVGLKAVNQNAEFRA